MHPRSDKKRPPQGKPAKRDDRAPAAGAPRPPRDGHFLWGRHAVLAALANPERRIAAIHASGDSADTLARYIADLPAARRDELPPISTTDRRRLDAIEGGTGEKAVHQGMAVAVWPLEPPALDDLLAVHANRPVRLICLDQLSDPRNVGAIMRSAAAFGAAAIVTQDRHAPPEGGVIAKSASGALEILPWVRVVNLARALDDIAEAGYWRLGLAGEAEATLGQALPAGPVALVLGAEGPGMRHNIGQHCDALARLPIGEQIESLNVSNAAAIALYAIAAR